MSATDTIPARAPALWLERRFALAARGLLVEQILAQAAGHEDLASANWTASTVAARLKNAAKCAARAHNAAA